MRTLSVQRMQLTADPEDWTWIRWQWCQPGALPLPFFHFTGYPLWEGSELSPIVGPQVLMEGGEWRGDEDSPFPGTDFEGPLEMWRNGVPADVRDTGEVQEECGAEVWRTEWPVNWIYEPDVVGPGLLVGRRGTPRGFFTGPATLPIPVGYGPGTVVVVALVTAGGTIGNPTGFPAAFFEHLGDNNLSVRLYQLTYTGAGGSYQYPISNPVQIASLAGVWLSRAGNPVAGTGDNGIGTAVNFPGVTVADDGSLLLAWGFNEEPGDSWTGPAGMSSALPDVPFNGMAQCWHEDDFPAGESGDRSATTVGGGAWIGVQVLIPPD